MTLQVDPTATTTIASVAPVVPLMLQPMLALMETTIQALPILELFQLQTTRQRAPLVALALMLVAKYESKIT